MSATPVSCLDVAAFILSKTGEITTMKLQKLVYYSQAWHLVWDEEPLFREEIQAWANGPVVPELYEKHRGLFQVRSLSGGEADALSASQRETVDEVLKFYGERSAWELSALTHQEPPWRDARSGLRPGERGKRVISHASMAEHYGSLA